MAHFDVYQIAGLNVVDMQSDLISLEYSRIVAPLRPHGEYQLLPRLTPKVIFGGEEYVVHVHDLAAVPGRQLSQPVGTLQEHRDELLRAIDILTRGF